VTGVHDQDRDFEERIAVAAFPWTIQPAKRGSYALELRLHLIDRLGWSRWTAPTIWKSRLTVEPCPASLELPPPSTTRRGRWPLRRSGQQAGDPFDVRPYLPGDDLRRLHWPLFAHAGQPFVRTASPSPLRTGHEFFLLDLGASHNDQLDFRLEVLLLWLKTLDQMSRSWTVVVPAADLTIREHPSALLAGLKPSNRPLETIPADWPEVVVLVTASASMAADQIENRLFTTKRQVLKIVLDRPAAQESPDKLWWLRR